MSRRTHCADNGTDPVAGDPTQTPEAADLLGLLESFADLGHVKRTEAFVRQVSSALSAPGASVTQAAGQGDVSPLADLMSLYRFAQNPEVDLAQLRAIRRAMVLSRFAKGADVVVVHDPTLLDYSAHNSKADRREIGDHRGRGYEYIPVAAVDPHRGQLVGVLHDTVVNDQGPDDREEMDYDYEPLFRNFDAKEKKRLRENHRHQMAVHVRGLAEELADYHAIHVADREFDDIFLLQAAAGADFVVRATALRNAQTPEAPWISPEARTGKQAGHPLREGWVYVNLKRLIEDIPLEPYKTIPLDSQGRRVAPGEPAHRQAHVSIGCCPVRLYRSAKRNKKYFRPPEPVELNLVVVREVQPPAGQDALLWALFSTLPVQTTQQRMWVAHLYELRWLIEVLIRLLKSGYRIEQLRLDNARKIGVALGIVTIAAMALIHLKRILGIGPGGQLDDDTYDKLKLAWRHPEEPSLTPQWALLGLVARYGGWLGRRRDPLGPTVLMRGMLLVLAVLHAFEQLGPAFLKIAGNPNIRKSIFCV